MCAYKIKQQRKNENKVQQEFKLTLDSTSRESERKLSLAKKTSQELNFPHTLFISRSSSLTLSSRESCINSLTSPTVLFWAIHDHSHKYLYQLSSTCEQKLISKKQHIYERKNKKPKWPTSLLKVFYKLVPRLLIYRAKMYAFLVAPHSKNLPTTEHPWTKTILSREGRRKLLSPDLMNKLIKMGEWVSERHQLTSDHLLSSWMFLIHEQKVDNSCPVNKSLSGG